MTHLDHANEHCGVYKMPTSPAQCRISLAAHSAQQMPLSSVGSKSICAWHSRASRGLSCRLRPTLSHEEECQVISKALCYSANGNGSLRALRSRAELFSEAACVSRTESPFSRCMTVNALHMLVLSYIQARFILVLSTAMWHILKPEALVGSCDRATKAKHHEAMRVPVDGI